jgi:hypothetical protein
MTRWRVLILVLTLLAILGLFLFVGQEWSDASFTGFPHGAGQSPLPSAVNDSLSELPTWVSSLATFVTLLLFGSANFYLFPARVRNLQAALTVSRTRSFHIILAGLAFGLLFVLTAISASLARATFPLTILTVLVLFVLAVWGYLALAYTLGRSLLHKADWLVSPFGALALGLLLLHALIQIPFAGIVFALLSIGAGLGVVITTRFGSMQPWDLSLLLEDWKV